MTVAAQRRLLTAETSRLGKVDIVSMLRKDDAWISLPRETREHLYSLLPPAVENEPARDPDVNPLHIERLKTYIEAELRRWQEDLTEGREVKKWRGKAMQAGKDHVDGKFDQWKVMARDEYWGKPDDLEAVTEGVAGGEGKEDKAGENVNGDGKAEVGSGKEVKDSDGEGSEL